jgi:hypothetical protein
VVSSAIDGERFALLSVTGPKSPFSVTSAENVTGTFALQYRLNVINNPSDEGATSPVAGEHWINANGTPIIYETPHTGYYFIAWLIDGSPAGNTTQISVYMDGPHDVEADFSSTNPGSAKLNTTSPLALMAFLSCLVSFRTREEPLA